MLRTFGQLCLEGGTLRRPKPLLLLAYLALDGPKARRFLAELFFPAARDPRDSLSSALKHVQTGSGALTLVGERVSADVPCDALLFRNHLENGRHKEALSLYGGPFLKDLSLELSSELEEWLLETREHFATLARGAHLTLGERALRSGDRRAARHHAEAAYRLEDAPPPEEADARRLHRLLSRAESSLLGRFTRETAPLGLRLAPRTGPPHNLPALLTSFVGREAERLELLKVLSESDGRLVTVHGPGGVGKTRLALEVAAESVRGPGFDDGAFFVPLDGVAGPAQLVPALARTLGAEPNEAALKERLGDRSLLVVLDTFEHLLDAAPLLPRLLAACPELRLLVTSRARLNLKAEWVLTLAGLALPEAGSDPERAALPEAVQLFVARARRAQVMFSPTPADLRAVVRICRAVGGFPLGLELAAAWVGTVSLAALADDLEVDAAALETPLKDVRARHRSVHAALEGSWRLLTLEQQVLLARLAVFQGGFTPEAALRVADAGPAALEELLARALLERSGARYGLHALVYAFARTKLAGDPEGLSRARERHGRFYGEVLGRLNLAASGGASPELLAFMSREEGNLLAFLAWALERNAYTQLGALAEPLLWHLPVQGRFAEAAALCEHVLGALPAGDPQAAGVRAAFLSSYGFVEFFAGDAKKAVRLAREALAVGAEDTLQALRALNISGQAQVRLGEAGAATEQLRRALALARGHGDPVRLLRTLANLAVALTNGDRFAEASRHLAEGFSLYRSGRVPKSMDVIALLTASVYLRLMREDYGAAAETVREALGIAEDIGSKGQRPLLLALAVLADLERAVLEHDLRALGLVEVRCRELLPLLVASGETLGRVLLLGALARCRVGAGDAHEALELLSEGHSFAWASGNLTGLLWTLPYTLEAALFLGDLELGGLLAGFIAASEQAGVWVRGRSQRALARATVPAGAQEAFARTIKQGHRQTLEAVLRRTLEVASAADSPV